MAGGTEHNRRTWQVDFSQATKADNLKLFRGARLLTDSDFDLVEFSEDELEAKIEKRNVRRIKDHLRRLSEEYGLASREMALVAVVERQGDVADELPRTTVVPVGLPQYVEPDAYWWAPNQTVDANLAMGVSCFDKLESVAAPEILRRCQEKMEQKAKLTPPDSYAELIKLAGALQADGGLLGDDLNVRIVKTAAAAVLYAIACFSGEVNLQPQLARMQKFLERVEKKWAYAGAAGTNRQGTGRCQGQAASELYQGTERRTPQDCPPDQKEEIPNRRAVGFYCQRVNLLKPLK